MGKKKGISGINRKTKTKIKTIFQTSTQRVLVRKADVTLCYIKVILHKNEITGALHSLSADVVFVLIVLFDVT